MRKTRSVPRILAALMAICFFVAVFCGFASAFDGDSGNSRGTLYTAMFGLEDGLNRNIVVPLMVAFIFLCLFVFVALAGFILGDKYSKIIGALCLIGGVTIGVMFLLTMNFYIAANEVDLTRTDETSLGAGPICVAVFSFIAAFFGGLDLLVSKKQ